MAAIDFRIEKCEPAGVRNIYPHEHIGRQQAFNVFRDVFEVNHVRSHIPLPIAYTKLDVEQLD